MNKTIKILAVIAIAQLLLTAMTWMGESELKGRTERSTLLGFNKAEINGIIIKGGENETALSKKEDNWQTSDDFPADQAKVTGLLVKLEGLKYSLPVATSSQAMKRFKVADDDFERHIKLQKNGKTFAQLYLGTGAGARQAHARNGEQNAVYSVSMGAYDAPSKVTEWRDKNLLQLDKNDISSIELDGLTLKPDTDVVNNQNAIITWKANNLPENKLVNQKTVNEDLGKLLSLRFSQVLGKQSKADYGLDKPDLTLSLVHKNGKRTYQFGKLKDSEDYVLKVSDRDEFFQIASFSGKPVVEKFVKDKWLIDKPATEAEKPKETEIPETQPVLDKNTE